MNSTLKILMTLVVTAGLAWGAGALMTLSCNSDGCREEPQGPRTPVSDEAVSVYDDASNDFHDTFTIEDLALHDDAFDEPRDTKATEEMAYHDDAFDEPRDPKAPEDLALHDDAFDEPRDPRDAEDMI